MNQIWYNRLLILTQDVEWRHNKSKLNHIEPDLIQHNIETFNLYTWCDRKNNVDKWKGFRSISEGLIFDTECLLESDNNTSKLTVINVAIRKRRKVFIFFIILLFSLIRFSQSFILQQRDIVEAIDTRIAKLTNC